MNKNELKKVLKPLIKECIKEVLFEEKGALSHIISEVATGLSSTSRSVVTEREQSHPKSTGSKSNIPVREQKNRDINKALREHKKKLLDAIGADAYGGDMSIGSSNCVNSASFITFLIYCSNNFLVNFTLIIP